MAATPTFAAKVPAFLFACAAVMLTALLSFILHGYLQPDMAAGNEFPLLTVSMAAILSLCLTTMLALLVSRKTRSASPAHNDIGLSGTDTLLFRLLAEKSSDMILIYASDCTIVYANPATAKHLGYSAGALLHANTMDFIHPDDRPPVREDMLAIKRGRDAPAREIRVLKNDGTFQEVELKGCSLKNSRRGAYYLGAILRDISERKQHEQQEQIRQDWEQTFNTMNDLVSVHDTNFIILKANRALCEFLGKKPEEIIGRPCYQVFHDQDEPYADCPHIKALASGSSVSGIIHDPHLGIPLEITCSPLFDARQQMKGSIHIGRVVDAVGSWANKSGDIVPICASCKGIRNIDGDWVPTEEFFSNRYGARFTHGICPDCQKKLYPEYITSPPAGS